MKSNMKKNSYSFEAEFEKLKSIVSEIESSEHDIEKMIALFEEGVKLSNICEKKIEQYKEKINLIISGEKEGTSWNGFWNTR